jgi:hypothetical protein
MPGKEPWACRDCMDAIDVMSPADLKATFVKFETIPPDMTHEEFKARMVAEYGDTGMTFP